MCHLKGFFRTLPRPKKSARVAAYSSARVHGHSSSSTLSAHQISPGTSAVQENQEEPIVWYDDELEQAWCRFEDHLGRVLLAPAHHGPRTMGATVGAQAVKVPQIQFFDDKAAGQFQFLDKVMAGPVLCNDSCRCSMRCSTLTSC